MNVLNGVEEVGRCQSLEEGWYWGSGQEISRSTVEYARQLGSHLLEHGIMFTTVPLLKDEISLQCSRKRNFKEVAYHFVVDSLGRVDALVYECGLDLSHDLYEFESVEAVIDFLKL